MRFLGESVKKLDTFGLKSAILHFSFDGGTV